MMRSGRLGMRGREVSGSDKDVYVQQKEIKSEEGLEKWIKVST